MLPITGEVFMFFLKGWRGECWENRPHHCHCWYGGVPHMWHLARQDQNLQVRAVFDFLEWMETATEPKISNNDETIKAMHSK